MSTFTTAKKAPPKPTVWNFAPVVSDEPGKILGFSGKLGAGKDSCCRYLYGLAMMCVLRNDEGQFMTEEAFVNDDGKLIVRDKEGLYWFNEDDPSPEVRQLLRERVWPFIRKFSTANSLKEFLCNVMRVHPSQLWGSHEDKNKPTHLLWEKVPTPVLKTVKEESLVPEGFKVIKEITANKNTTYLCKRHGNMTGRETMEYFGMLIREWDEDAWANSLIGEILSYNSAYSLVNDVRLLNEVTKIQAVGGKVIRLTRTTEEASKNDHISNTALDNYENFDYVLDNQNMTLVETFGELTRVLIDWGWFRGIST